MLIIDLQEGGCSQEMLARFKAFTSLRNCETTSVIYVSVCRIIQRCSKSQTFPDLDATTNGKHHLRKKATGSTQNHVAQPESVYYQRKRFHAHKYYCPFPPQFQSADFEDSFRGGRSKIGPGLARSQGAQVWPAQFRRFRSAWRCSKSSITSQVQEWNSNGC